MFPRGERFGLTAQVRRAAVSIPSNIAEGKRRKKEKVYLNHLDIALGSQAEVEVQVDIAKRVGLLRDADYRQLANQVDAIGRMLNGLIASIQPTEPTSSTSFELQLVVRTSFTRRYRLPATTH